LHFGFSLLETLVALVITALASVLLMQGLSQALMLRDRILEQTQFQREDILRRAWFKDSVNALMADLPRIQRHRFDGTPDGFRGLTLAALQERPGVPVPIGWSVEQEADVFHLYYQQPDRDRQRVWSWRAQSARFAYFDPQRGWQPEWPPPERDAAPLPQAIALTTQWRDRPLTWVAAVLGHRTVRQGLEPLEGIR
jgi:hypothetical protein